MAWDVHNPLAYIPDDGTEEGPFEPVYAEDGVDLSLIRWTLAMTPAERLDVLRGSVRLAVWAEHAGEPQRTGP